MSNRSDSVLNVCGAHVAVQDRGWRCGIANGPDPQLVSRFGASLIANIIRIEETIQRGSPRHPKVIGIHPEGRRVRFPAFDRALVTLLDHPGAAKGAQICPVGALVDWVVRGTDPLLIVTW